MIHSQENTPLYDALLSHMNKKSISCHVPGHKNSAVFHSKGKEIFEELLKIDMTELDGLDDLHAPEGPILEAQLLLSQLYNTERSYFLINGSTCGNLAVIMGVCNEGDVVFVQRNCHKSVLHGLMLAKVKPIFLQTNYNEDWGTAEGVLPQTLEKALVKYPNAKALVLTYPSYYGIGGHIQDLVCKAHQSGLCVIVDEAHGAHFIAGEPFMKSSLAYGADYVVQSAHKTLPAMTMGSYLHRNHGAPHSEKVELYLQMLQSSSPSYPIMVSLDLARSYIGTLSKEDLQYTKDQIVRFKSQLRKISGIKVLEKFEEDYDILKLTIQAQGPFSGYDLQSKLNQAGVYVELADPYNILFVLPILKQGQYYPYNEIIRAIEKIVFQLNQQTRARETLSITKMDNDKELTELALSFNEMKNKKTCFISIEDAENKIAAETITPYPPGIPCILNGERLNKKKILYIQDLVKLGTKFHGGANLTSNNQIRIYI